MHPSIVRKPLSRRALLRAAPSATTARIRTERTITPNPALNGGASLSKSVNDRGDFIAPRCRVMVIRMDRRRRSGEGSREERVAHVAVPAMRTDSACRFARVDRQ